MRIWDVDVADLCRQHLLGEHRELHGLWNILTKHGGTGGYSHHPETKRWVGKLSALYLRHEAIVAEMIARDYTHNTPLDKALAIGQASQDVLINSIPDQRQLLANKPCPCYQDKIKKP